MSDEIMEILPLPEGKGGEWQSLKNRRTRFLNEIQKLSGLNEEWLGKDDFSQDEESYHL